jgi:hypothetical protein
MSVGVGVLEDNERASCKKFRLATPSTEWVIVTFSVAR